MRTFAVACPRPGAAATERTCVLRFVDLERVRFAFRRLPYAFVM